MRMELLFFFFLLLRFKVLSVRLSHETSQVEASGDSGGPTNECRRLDTSTWKDADGQKLSRSTANVAGFTSRVWWDVKKVNVRATVFNICPTSEKYDRDSERESLPNRLLPAALNWTSWASYISAAFIASAHESTITLDHKLFFFFFNSPAVRSFFTFSNWSKSQTCTDTASSDQGISWNIT